MTASNEHEPLAKRAEETVNQRFKTACQMVEKAWGTGSAPKCPALVTALVESIGREAQTETFKNLAESSLRAVDERLCSIASEIETLTLRVDGLHGGVYEISVAIKDGNQANQTITEMASRISFATAAIVDALEKSNDHRFGVPYYPNDRACP